MPKTNTTRYAVLGLLNLQPASGYDLKRFVDSAMGHFWNESYRWIYATLGQLQARGLAAARPDERGERERVVYRITSKGQRELRRWLAEAPGPLRVRDELLLKVLFGHMAPPGVTVEHIRRHHERMLRRHHELAELEGRLDARGLDGPGRQHAALTLGFGRRIAAAHLRWCEDALKQLQAAPRRNRRSARRAGTR